MGQLSKISQGELFQTTNFVIESFSTKSYV
jgi:hypothetical protein